MNSFKIKFTTYLLGKVLSWINLNELKKILNLLNPNMEFGRYDEIIARCVHEFMLKKKNHSFKKETIILCSILIENNKDLSYLTKKKRISIKEASEIKSFLNKIILW